MPRPRKERRIESLPHIVVFKPAGVPLKELDEVILSIDEMEAIRLTDMQELDQASAAQAMGISRPTVHRLVSEARRKVATALWEGKALKIEGGNIRLNRHCQGHHKHLPCPKCGQEESSLYEDGLNGQGSLCPACGRIIVLI